ncbi:phosphodiester glycosidase family protein [Paenibacillus sp. N1-5-1-14]|uniref:phosphodiester glycosidase family protein n=1 Tax=Paenibacillus radicibacter TaxID=2972488 RepID=UPI002159428A|nr:phosphodiester glycosidase family protein [Paenibacillus radicibacter]MCR8643836.1 phosphodiester glycosidase family protein [Paenibacillus radicibacter]
MPSSNQNPNLRARPANAAPPRPRRKRKKKKRGGILLPFFLILLGIGILSSAWFFLTPSGSNLRYMLADTLITTQHREWAKYIIGKDELDKRVADYLNQFEEMGKVKEKPELVKPNKGTTTAAGKKPKDAVTIEPIEGKGFKGQLLTIRDPKMLRLVVTQNPNKGETVSSMVKRTGAIAGVNAGGFHDPEWKGNGFQPEGIVISNGKLIYNDGNMNSSFHIVGIDKEGRLVAGRFKVSEIMQMNIQEGVSFPSKFIANGKGLIKSQKEGWGIAPRTSMAQTADGTILFAIIDGRQTHSLGASLYDIQQIFLSRGAITAANLDGGSSSVLVHNNKIVNKPSSEYGERYLPTAWLVFDDPAKVNVKNIWAGLDPSKIDPSKW